MLSLVTNLVHSLRYVCIPSHIYDLFGNCVVALLMHGYKSKLLKY